MGVIAVREFERIACAPCFDPVARTVTPAQQYALEQFASAFRARKRADVLRHGPKRSLVAQNYVGVIGLGEHQLEILPKIVGADDQKVRANLAAMVAAAAGLELDSVTDASLATSRTFLEVVAALFCRRLMRLFRKGLVRQYRRQEENLSFLRGRLIVHLQVQRNAAHPERLACEFDEFTEDNLLNRTLKAALRVLSGLTSTAATSSAVEKLLFMLQDVSDVSVPTLSASGPVSLDRLSADYEHALRLAELFIRGSSTSTYSGAGRSFAMLFDMNELFERYVGAALRGVFARRGQRVVLQGPRKNLAQSALGCACFWMRPDASVLNLKGVDVVVDTKWKRFNEGGRHAGVASADIYQMYAYASRYRSSEVILLYPHHDGLGPWRPRRAEYLVDRVGKRDEGAERSVIAVATLDLRDLKSIPSQLEAIVGPVTQIRTNTPRAFFGDLHMGTALPTCSMG